MKWTQSLTKRRRAYSSQLSKLRKLKQETKVLKRQQRLLLQSIKATDDAILGLA